MTDFVGAVVQLYAFDAYGNALGFDPSQALTEFLYSGEQFDAKIGQQYLRARYYDPATGRFNRLDPFFGNLDDPQSFHKYLYCHAYPVNGIDPSGLVFGGITVAMTILSLASFVGFPVLGIIGAENLAYGASLPWTSLKTTSRLAWQKVIDIYLKPKNYVVAAFLMEHSLQDSPRKLNFGHGHFIAEKIRSSSEYKTFKENLIKEFSPGDVFANEKRGIRFTSTDLFLGIHRATMTVSGRINENRELVNFRAELYDIYDFALTLQYQSRYWTNLQSMMFGAMAIVANNIAWSDQQVGVIVPYEFTVNVE